MTEGKTITRVLLLDIEGTVTPISFVHDILFPFSRNHLREYLTQHATTTELKDALATMQTEYVLDEERPRADASDWSTDAIVAYVNWLIDRDRKSPALKSLQGMIWKQGYQDGTLKAPLFDDVVPTLRRLRKLGIGVSIFSSGSVLAQKLLFAHTETGDHTNLIDRYFDTSVGSKVNPASYREIARQLEIAPNEVTFVSDVTTELSAASEAGMETLLSLRPGNKPQPLNAFQSIRVFSEIL